MAYHTARLLNQLATDKEKLVDKDKRKPDPLLCSCIQDLFVDLPPDLRPKPVQRMRGLSKVTCPGCGLVYWTNRKTDVCPGCERKGFCVVESQSGH